MRVSPARPDCGSHLLAEGRDDSLRDEVGHLGLVPADGQVGDGPGRLLLGLELTLGEVGDDHGDETGLDDCLDLLLVASRDVGEEPDCLLQVKYRLRNLTEPLPRFSPC